MSLMKPKILVTGAAGFIGFHIAQRLLNEGRRGMARLANAQADGTISRVGRDTRKQLAQPLERVGLQQVKTRIHGWRQANKRVRSKKEAGIVRASFLFRITRGMESD